MSHLGWHGVRVKFFVRIACALIKLQSINYIKLYEGLGGKANLESNLRRIQRFLGEFDFNFNLDTIACLVFKLLSLSDPYTLPMDRTKMMLPGKGNSNTEERKQLVKLYIRLFWEDSTECLLADRKFIGKHWFD